MSVTFNTFRHIAGKVRDQGFTLIEILAVIAIISLLMGILLPALGRAHEEGRCAMCLANVRRISMAGTIYALENDGFFPPFRMTKSNPEDTSNFVNRYGREKPRWPWFFDHGIGPVINPAPYINNPGDTFGDSDTLIMTNDFFMCPSFRHRDFDKRDIRNGSYGYNYQYLGNTRTETDGDTIIFKNFPVHMLNIHRPVETIIIADSRGASEGRGRSIAHGRHSYTLDPPRLARSKGAQNFAHKSQSGLENQHSPAEARHSRKVNVSFLDGHAAKMTLKEMGYALDSDGYVIADDPAGTNRLWTGTGHDEPQAN